MMYTSHLKLVAVPIAIMYYFPIKLPWSPKQYMAHIHKHDVTSHFILIAAYLEVKFTLFCNEQWMSFMQPWNFIRCGMFNLLQIQLFHHFSGHYIISAPTVNYHFTTLPLNLACSSKQSLSLWRLYNLLLWFQQNLVHKKVLPNLRCIIHLWYWYFGLFSLGNIVTSLSSIFIIRALVGSMTEFVTSVTSIDWLSASTSTSTSLVGYSTSQFMSSPYLILLVWTTSFISI